MGVAGRNGPEPDFIVEVALPPEEALASIADPTRWSEWVPHFVSCEPADDEKGGWFVASGQPPERYWLAVRSFEPGRSAEVDRTPIEGGSAGMKATLAVRVEPTAAGSRLLVRYRQAEGHRTILGRIDAAFTRWGLQSDLERWARSLDAAASDPSDPDAAALEAIRRELLPPRPKAFNWRLLVGSALVFVAIGWMLPSWRESILWLVPILLVHEFSHYLAMRRFGYRNLQMMFIPFFGAVVTGHRFNEPAWKRCVVALAGPIPSLAVAGVGAVVAAEAGWVRTADVLLIAIGVNGFNLLPIFPLDGGQVVQAVIFSRTPLLDAVFRSVAAVAVIVVGWWGEAWVLSIVGMLMIFGLPEFYRRAGVARRLRRSGFRPVSPDGDTIAVADGRRILAELRASSPKPLDAATLADRTTAVYTLLNARPPGLLASLAFLGLQFGGIVFAIVTAFWTISALEAAQAAR